MSKPAPGEVVFGGTVKELAAALYGVPIEWVPDSMGEAVEQPKTASGERRSFLKNYTFAERYGGNKVDLPSFGDQPKTDLVQSDFSTMELRLVADLAATFPDIYGFKDKKL